MVMDTPHTDEDVLDAKALLKRAGLNVAMTAADLGCGRDGSFVIAASRIVTDSGRVYAVDIVKDVLAVMQEKAKEAGVHNVVTVWSDLEVFGGARQITTGSLDVGILANTLFQSEKREDMVAESLRMIKMGGTLLVVEWKPVATPFGPPLELRVKPEDLKKHAQRHGAVLVDEFEAGEYHWGLIFHKQT